MERGGSRIDGPDARTPLPEARVYPHGGSRCIMAAATTASRRAPGAPADAMHSGRKVPMSEIRTGTLLDMVAYQDGAVVSRTLVDRKTGTVTLFAFAQGQGLSEHTAPFDALIQVLDGEAEIRISGEPFRVRAGEMILLPADEPHALKAVERFKMMLTMIRS